MGAGMSGICAPLAESAVAAQPAHTQQVVKRPPAKRQIVARSDFVSAPEPR